jgi:hypothetical protein
VKYTIEQRDKMIEALDHLVETMQEFFNKLPDDCPKAEECTCISDIQHQRHIPLCPIHRKKEPSTCQCPPGVRDSLFGKVCGECGKPLPEKEKIEELDIGNYEPDLIIKYKLNEIIRRLNK